jgi:hypothetical protein
LEAPAQWSLACLGNQLDQLISKLSEETENQIHLDLWWTANHDAAYSKLLFIRLLKRSAGARPLDLAAS